MSAGPDDHEPQSAAPQRRATDQGERRRVMCFLRMASAQEEQAVGQAQSGKKAK